MPDLLFQNIRQLLQVRPSHLTSVAGGAMDELPLIEDAFLLVKGGRIADFGPMSSCPSVEGKQVVDATGKLVLPSWCDSHTHLVYAGDRSGEYEDRIRGLSYAEIAARGGGILNSAARLAATEENELYHQSKARLTAVAAAGTGAIEIKSGYGLTLDAELKMLRVIRRLRDDFDLPIRSTFLAAHAIPTEYRGRKAAYVDRVVKEWIPAVAATELADYFDVFCERDYFSAEDTDRMLKVATRYGMPGKIHANQFTVSGGVAVAVENDARSVDHLELLADEDVAALQRGTTIPVALPGCSFFLGIPYTPARRIVDAGLPLALATDYNPGSAPSGSMHFVVAAACARMGMTPAEAINAATLNGAAAMDLADEVGSITVGKRANLILTTPLESFVGIPYQFGQPPVETVYLAGRPL